MPQIRLFLSAVSAEFRSYRDAMRRDLERPNVTVKIQEDFIATGSETLDKLDEYISQCDAVIHLVGNMTGALAQVPSLQLISNRYPDLAKRLPPLKPCLEPDGPPLSYTQWEAWLALYHGKTLIIAVPEPAAPRDEQHPFQAEQQYQQQQHLARLAELERYPEISFANADRLSVAILRSKLHDLLARAGALHKPANLPAASLGELFKGRNTWLEKLSHYLGPVPDSAHNSSRALVLSGLGGVGKTRLALEYAWRQDDNYAASLFVGADSPDLLQRNLAELCRASLLNLPEQTEIEEARQRDAVLAWLRQHPGWLLILDNADTETAAEAAEALLPQLSGGHLLITSRLSNWSGNLPVMRLDTLALADAADFLLARTAPKRRKQDDDNAQADILADELGGLALALEQAGAYIAQGRLTLKGYLGTWLDQREKVLAWYDPRLMQYPCSVAVTWQTSFAQLGAPARHLLERLAWLSPAPIPESLLEVPIPDVETETDPFAALAELEAYSLISRDQDHPSFSVHRLVQEVTRRRQTNPGNSHLIEALRWLNATFVGEPDDVRNWPLLNPLVPHAQAVAEHADAAGITDPTARLMNQLGLMYLTKCLFAEAEPLMRRALSITETCFGVENPEITSYLNNLALLLQDTNRLTEAELLMRQKLSIDVTNFGIEHPEIRLSINNIAQLLQDTNRLTEAEPLMRQALIIDETCFGEHHPNVACDLNNLALLLQDTNRLAEAEPLMWRALSIDETYFGPDHPTVARDLNNLAQLLQDTNRLTAAEPMMRRALSIDETYFGPDHPTVARDLNNLAQLLQDTNRLAEAEPIMRRALSIDESSFGPSHPNIAVRLNNLARLLQDTNRLAEAEPLMRRALKIGLQSQGIEHPYSEIAWTNYISLLSELGKTEVEIKQILAGLFD